jgi:hypothetical protein
MAKIKNAKGRTGPIEDSGYYRVTGNKDLATLISKVHATSISAGSELENIIITKLKENNYTFDSAEEMDAFLKDNILTSTPKDGLNLFKVFYKKIIKKSTIFTKLKLEKEPDFIIFDNGTFYIVELKDGDQFDTKKVSGEVKVLKDYEQQLKNIIGSYLPYKYHSLICSFSQNDPKLLITGFKSQLTYFDETKFDEVSLIGGKKLCNILKIDYAYINTIRASDQKENEADVYDGILKALQKQVFEGYQIPESTRNIINSLANYSII